MKRSELGFVGCGQFCKFFVLLFKAHPAVEFVAVTDKFPERCREYDEKFGVDRIFDCYDDNLPGLTAHVSAMEGGATMEVPDLGDPPEEMKVLSADRKENEVKYQ